MGPDGNSVRGVQVSICDERMLWREKPVRGLGSDYVPIPGMGVSSGKAAPTERVPEDGTILLLGLAPGRYVVRVQGNEPAEPVTVEVHSGKTTRAKLVIGEAKPPAAP